MLRRWLRNDLPVFCAGILFTLLWQWHIWVALLALAGSGVQEREERVCRAPTNAG